MLLVFTQELLESLSTLTGAERDTSGLRVVEKEDAIPSTSTSTVPLLGEEEEAPETTRNRIQRDHEDETGDIRVHGTEETLPDPRSSPLAFSGDYTTLEMFQRGCRQRHRVLKPRKANQRRRTPPGDIRIGLHRAVAPVP